jgi:predicted AlkP superfamily phosphohydrolase/phosphomutase
VLLVVGWDGACVETLGRFAAGRTPVFDELRRRGSLLRVRSTTPPVTFPAWTSFLTGAEPDRHGITDFTIPRRDTYGVRFANATDRRLPTFVARLAAAGVRSGIYGMPATSPPEGRGVFEIAGFDTPLGPSSAAHATHPKSLAAELRRRHGRLGIEGIRQNDTSGDWHERALAQLIADIELRTEIALELFEQHRLEVFVVHFMESDTVSHHFRQFDDAASPLAREGPRGAIGDVYAALDRSLGRLLEAAGAGTDLMLLSDHGSAGGSDRVIFWNRWLADRGYLSFRNGGREPAALRWKRRALAAVPPAWQATLFAAARPLADRLESSARFAGIDWSATQVFCDEVPYFPSLRFNAAGREPSGIVAAQQIDELCSRVTEELLDLRDPFDGGPVVVRVEKRQQRFDGPFAGRYPDLLLELRRPNGFAYAAMSSRGGLESQWMRRLGARERSGAKGSPMSGVHGDVGLALLAGPRCALRAGVGGANAVAVDAASENRADAPATDCTLADLGATVLALAGVAADERVQGRSVVAFAATGAAVPLRAGETVQSDPVPWDDDDAREVEERLRGLGYLP